MCRLVNWWTDKTQLKANMYKIVALHWIEKFLALFTSPFRGGGFILFFCRGVLNLKTYFYSYGIRDQENFFLSHIVLKQAFHWLLASDLHS